MAEATELTCVRQDMAVDDSDLSVWSIALEGLGVALAAYQFKEATDFAKKEYDIANKYWNIAQWWVNYYNGTYAPVENIEVAEALSPEEPTPIYETARGRARLAVWLENRGAYSLSIRCISKYNTGLRDAMLAEFASTVGAGLAMADGLGYRNERAYLETRDDINFTRKLETAKRGRDMIADNVSLSQAAAGIYGSAFNQAWQGLQGAGMLWGYKNNRNDTSYPTVFTGERDRKMREAEAASRAAVQDQERRAAPPDGRK